MPFSLRYSILWALPWLLGGSMPASEDDGGLASEHDGGLPSVECVETLRGARIQAARGATEAAIERLEGAIELPGCDLPALADLVLAIQAAGPPADRAATYRQRLLGLLADSKIRLSPGMASYIAWFTRAADRPPLITALQRRQRNSAELGRTLPVAERMELLAVLTSLHDLVGEPAQARESLGRLLELAPTDANRWRALILDERLERWESALGLLEELMQGSTVPEYLGRLHVLALAHLGRYDAMLAALDELAPTPPSTGDLDTVIRLPEDAMADRFAALLVRAAWALRDANRDAEAEATFRRAQRYAPDAPETEEARLALLHLYASEEERVAHQAALDQRRREETDPSALYEEGSRLLASGDAEAARELLARAAPDLSETPFAEAAWYNLGIAAFRLEHWEQAAEAFAEAVTIEPGRAEAHRQRGIALYQLQRCDESVASLRRSIELQPKKHQAYYYLAACYDALGDREAATKARDLYQAGPR